MQDAARRPLTPKQQEIYDFICRFNAENGRIPMLREISAHMGYTHVVSSGQMVRAIVEKGWLEKRPGHRGFFFPRGEHDEDNGNQSDGRLTDRQWKYYEFIREFAIENFRVPTVQEVADRIGVSIPQASTTISQIIATGFLTRPVKHSNTYALAIERDCRHYIRLRPGEGATIGGVFIGCVQTEGEDGVIQVVEVIAPDIMGKLEREK